jgi:hypothetical protein
MTKDPSVPVMDTGAPSTDDLQILMSNHGKYAAETSGVPVQVSMGWGRPVSMKRTMVHSGLSTAMHTASDDLSDSVHAEGDEPSEWVYM